MIRSDGMKFVVVRFDGKKKEKKAGKYVNFEKLLMLSFAAVFGLLVIVQILLATPSVRPMIAEDTEFEGSPVSNEEFLYKEGEVVLELTGSESDQNIKVIKNGDEAADFSNKLVKLTVREGDVIEIDGTASIYASEVSVSWCSDNIRDDSVGKKVKVFSDVKNLLRIKME